MKRKIIEMLAPADTDQAHYEAGETYAVPPAIAERFVRENVAKYVEVEVEDDDEPRSTERPDSQKPWRETVRPGDVFRWQITLSLPAFDKAHIIPELLLELDEAEFPDRGGIVEIGGDGKEPSS